MNLDETLTVRQLRISEGCFSLLLASPCEVESASLAEGALVQRPPVLLKSPRRLTNGNFQRSRLFLLRLLELNDDVVALREARAACPVLLDVVLLHQLVQLVFSIRGFRTLGHKPQLSFIAKDRQLRWS